MSSFAMTIDGEAMAADRSFDVVNPATGAVFAAAPDCTPEQLLAAMESAQAAFTTWRHAESERRRALAEAADALEQTAPELADVLTREQGKPLRDARWEILAAAQWLRYFAALPIPREVIRDDEKALVESVHVPQGVVAAITPWNFPVLLAAWKLAPALLAGNTMVLKPSPYTPLTTLEVGAVLAKVLPPGVLNVVSGGDSLGAQMTTHPTPRKISFTGSTAAGRQVALAAAADFKAVTLELGGNDPAIVLDDAEPRAIAKKLFWAAFTNNGQVCSAAKRVYVPEALHDELVDALAQQAGSVRVGDGTAERTQLGPINNRAQFDRVRGLVDDALSRGAVPAAGGHVIEGPGYFFEPTILAGATDGMPVVDEEQFGPVLPVIPYRDVDEAVARANAGEFGLTGSVWGTDRDRAAEVAARLDCGTVRVNDHSTLAPDQPFSGRKSSGLGVENGMPGLLSYTDVQVRYHSKR